MAKSWDKFEEAAMVRCGDRVSCGCLLLCPLPQVRGWVVYMPSPLHYIRDQTLLDVMMVPKLPDNQGTNNPYRARKMLLAISCA